MLKDSVKKKSVYNFFKSS